LSLAGGLGHLAVLLAFFAAGLVTARITFDRRLRP
jgi:uncharacterized membrane protein